MAKLAMHARAFQNEGFSVHQTTAHQTTETTLVGFLPLTGLSRALDLVTTSGSIIPENEVNSFLLQPRPLHKELDKLFGGSALRRPEPASSSSEERPDRDTRDLQQTFYRAHSLTATSPQFKRGRGGRARGHGRFVRGRGRGQARGKAGRGRGRGKGRGRGAKRGKPDAKP